MLYSDSFYVCSPELIVTHYREGQRCKIFELFAIPYSNYHQRSHDLLIASFYKRNLKPFTNTVFLSLTEALVYRSKQVDVLPISSMYSLNFTPYFLVARLENANTLRMIEDDRNAYSRTYPTPINIKSREDEISYAK